MFPVAFRIGDLAVYSYGVAAALAVLAAFVMTARRAGRYGFPKEALQDLVILSFVSGVAGARLFYVFQNMEDYRARPWEVLYLREGGLIWYGGFLTAAIFLIGYAMRRHWPVLRLCDFFAPILAAAHAIGRLGCFLNGCCHGVATVSPWGLRFPGEDFRRHPVQLYEAFLLTALAIYLEAGARRKKRDGDVLVGYLLGYSTIRFGLEYLRADQPMAGALTAPQWTSLLIFSAGVLLHFTKGGKRSAGKHA